MLTMIKKERENSIYRRNTMSIKKMTKDELELLSNKDITNLLLEEKGN